MFFKLPFKGQVVKPSHSNRSFILKIRYSVELANEIAIELCKRPDVQLTWLARDKEELIKICSEEVKKHEYHYLISTTYVVNTLIKNLKLIHLK